MKSQTLNEEQWQVFQTLLQASDRISVQQIVAATGIDHPKVSAAIQYGEEQGWLATDEQSREELTATAAAASQLQAGLPERRALALLAEPGRIAMRDLAQNPNLPMSDVIKWGSLRGWFDKDKGDLVLTDQGRRAFEQPDADERALELAVARGGTLFLDELAANHIDAERVRLLVQNRGDLAKLKPRTLRFACLTENGRRILTHEVTVVKERNMLTPEDITSGEWQNIRLRRYDVTLASENVYPAKIHLMQKIIQLTRKAFLEMGFSEIVSPMVESAFWDFDALFQPQDHPARDMQDTFYLQRPAQAQLPADEIVDRVKRTHENGGETGSRGWGYRWNVNRARQVVMRTHTTACTIRALARNPQPPQKVFCVGKVFRNEAISYKHLPEFFQVDGILVDKDANLATLLGTLKEFYRKMGFNKIKFKPAFFPYTEPSVEVFVYMESKQSWIELGGSGVFRPEVTRPFGCQVPVLAWGLGLDRLAMLRYGLHDIRELYWSDLDRIMEAPLCQ